MRCCEVSPDIVRLTKEEKQVKEHEQEELWQCQLSELENRLDTERKYLTVLFRKYISVYNVDLNTGMAEVLKLDSHADAWKISRMRPGMKFVYEDHIQNFADLFVVNDATLFKRMLSKAYITQRMQSSLRYSFRFETVSNEEDDRFYEVQVVRVNADHFDGRVLVVSEKIDDIMRAERQHQIELGECLEREKNLIKKAEEADLANRAKTDFISRIAHDIRIPMNSILGFLEIASAHLDDKERVKYSLDQIRVAGEFLNELVGDVLDVLRMETGLMKICPKPVSFSVMLEGFADFMRNAKKEKKQGFQCNIHDILYDTVLVDSLHLRQIYANLLSNAMKYTPEVGMVEFEAYQELLPNDKKVRIVAKITDTGIGMSEEFMDRMFCKYERAIDTQVNSVSGYGLGLTIVKQLVNLMEGTLDVHSQLNEGTTVCVKIDVPYLDCELDMKPVGLPDYAAVCSGMHLLVAEDNELNREVIGELLSMYQITCDYAEDGDICVEQFKAAECGRYDAILMDMQMPNMNGVEAARRIRDLPYVYAKEVMIIAMTANALNEDVQKCLDAGMNIHLTKPIDMKQLLEILGTMKKQNGVNRQSEIAGDS